MNGSCHTYTFATHESLSESCCLCMSHEKGIMSLIGDICSFPIGYVSKINVLQDLCAIGFVARWPPEASRFPWMYMYSQIYEKEIMSRIGVIIVDPRQHAETHCNSLRPTATHCNALQRTATHCNALRLIATHCDSLQLTATHCDSLQRAATHFN